MSDQRINRINVAVNPAMLDAIDRVIENEQVTLTEAVRRLIGYGDYVYRAKLDGTTLLAESPGSGQKEVILV